MGKIEVSQRDGIFFKAFFLLFYLFKIRLITSFENFRLTPARSGRMTIQKTRVEFESIQVPRKFVILRNVGKTADMN